MTSPVRLFPCLMLLLPACSVPEPAGPSRPVHEIIDESVVFKAGHRIRLEISSSNFPRFARNQNIGEPLGTSDKIVVAKQTVYHNAQYPSHLVLPVIPAGSAN